MFKFVNVLFLMIYLVYCYVPVEFEKHKIQGEWIFRISNETFQANLNNPKTSCGNGFPGNIDTSIGDGDYSFSSFRDIHVTLNNDFKVFQGGIVTGYWTPVYNQGFIANINNSEFTVFMKYYKNPKKTNSYLSNCDKTMMGWYIQDIKQKLSNWSCFFGFKSKINKNFSRKIKNFLKIDYEKKLDETNTNLDFIQTNSRLHSVRYDEKKDIIDEINNKNSTWKAGFNSNFKGMSFAKIFKKINYKSKFIENKSNKSQIIISSLHNNTKVQNDSSKREADSKDVIDQMVINKYKDVENLDEIDAATLPLNWDWRNIGKINYFPGLTNQHRCSSCYAIAAMNVLDSKLRIQTYNKDTTRFSKQYPLSCSPYTQGCEGGFSVLVGKFSNEFELIPDNCFPYEATNSDCKKRCDNSKSKIKYTVSKYGFVGGHYGATTEELMMKEIRAHGPIIVNMITPVDFLFYKSGIYMNKSLTKNSSPNISKVSILDKNIDWMVAYHVVLILGWGEKKGMRFWIGGNSWGSDFGKNGFFKIIRGENECNIESMAEFLNLKVENR